MAKQKREKADSSPPRTVLGKTTSFSGRLKFAESLKIDGRFRGSIESTGFLHIEEGAEAEADSIRAARVLIGGTVRGDIEASDSVDMLPTAKVYGNVRTAKLRIADGVIFEGRCDMVKSADAFNPFSHERLETNP
jgi:cytoskeletal protein CcmA (bactofilin family)